MKKVTLFPFGLIEKCLYIQWIANDLLKVAQYC